MIPIRTTVLPQRVPWANYALIGANLVVFAYELTLGVRIEAFVWDYGWVSANFSQALHQQVLPPLFPLLSCMFLHGSWLHLLGNLLYLHIFGGSVEDRCGHVRYLIFYCVGGMVAVFVQTYSAPLSTTPMIGASGAVAAVTGAYLVLFPTARVVTVLPVPFSLRLVSLPAGFYLLLWFTLQLVSGVYAQTPGNRELAQVAWWAHVGGFVVGVLVGMTFLLGRRRRPRRSRPHSQLVWNNPRSALR
ncbi:MAG: rhomboid family intramembrane serine protease [Deltaproteobacteria bacterium]|nr:rhomboid family intramembrane serine protease [Deltaproteobacteria bacterium]